MKMKVIEFFKFNKFTGSRFTYRLCADDEAALSTLCEMFVMFVSITEELLVQLNILSLLSMFSQVQTN